MKYVFGPVPSRRLGQSLGIDTIPLKTCNWNCVYCQLGRTKPLTNQRQTYFPPEEILMEIKQSLDSHAPGDINWVTFVGSGEPTLHTDIGWLIRQVKQITEISVAVITNGSLFYLPEVLRELTAADAVLPSLDAGTSQLYRRINRPHPEVTFERYLKGLIAFRKEYRGKLWIEVMLIRDINDTDEALQGISKAIDEIMPDEVHINFPTRPPVETWVHPPEEERLLRAIEVMGKFAKIIYPAEGTFDLSGYENPLDAILGIITRHPMQQAQIERSLHQWSPKRVQAALEKLAACGQVQRVSRSGNIFWCTSLCEYPGDTESMLTSPEAIKLRSHQ